MLYMQIGLDRNKQEDELYKMLCYVIFTDWVGPE